MLNSFFVLPCFSLAVPLAPPSPPPPAALGLDLSTRRAARPGAEQDVQSHAAEGGRADLARLQRGGDRRAAARQRRPQQHFPPIREVCVIVSIVYLFIPNFKCLHFFAHVPAGVHFLVKL